jgi:5'-3' exonuclease
MSIPDYLALVGDAADGYPGLDGWGERSAAAIIGFYEHLEVVPQSAEAWKVQVRGADRLAKTLQENFKLAQLFRDLATLRTKEPKIRNPNQIRWRGPNSAFSAICRRLDEPRLADRVAEIATSRKAEKRNSERRRQA